MLEFSKTLIDVEHVNPNITSHFAITADGSTMVTIRFIKNKAYRLIVKLDGTVGHLGAKVNELTKLSDDDFITFSDIQFKDVEDVI